MDQYVKLIEDSLFEEAYLVLKRNVEKMDDTLMKNKHLRDFFITIFSDDIFKTILEKNAIYPHLLQLANATVKNLKNEDFLKDMAPKLGNFIDNNKIMIMFVFLVQSNEFNNAEVLLPYFNKNLSGFPQTLKEVINNNNVPALRFLCEKMDNIHFNEGGLLRLISPMNPQAIKMLVEDFKFDINEQSQETGYNLIHTLIAEKNVKNFKFIVENYGAQINWAATIMKKNRNSNITVFDMIDQMEMQMEFFAPILDNMMLKSNYVNRMSESLLQNRPLLTKACDTDVYHRLFSHPGFDPNVVNLDQGHFLYGILSELGKEFQRSGEAAAKPLFKVLDAYIDSSTEDDIPVAVNFHIVGAAVHVASELDSKIVTDAASLILKRYNKYVNKPNPFGQLPIMQVEKDSPVYRLLVNNGAIAPEPEQGIWNIMISVFKKKKNQEFVEDLNAATQSSQQASTNNSSLVSLRNKMRDDFRVMRNYTSHHLCDPTIKMRCENMFLKSDKLVMQMEKHGVNQAFEDMFFLGENFSKYLKESLRIYIEVCEATVDFTHGATANAKLGEAKKKCMEQVELLSEQLSLITENIFNQVEDNAVRQMNARSRFLQNRFPSEADLGFEGIMEKNQESLSKLQKDSTTTMSETMNQTLANSEQEYEISVENLPNSNKEESNPMVINIFDNNSDQQTTIRKRKM